MASHVPGSALTLAMLNSIESGATQRMTPVAAKALVDAAVIPVTMTEIVQAMGYELPLRHPPKKQELLSVVESLRPEEDEALRIWLRGLLSLRKESLERGPG